MSRPKNEWNLAKKPNFTRWHVTPVTIYNLGCASVINPYLPDKYSSWHGIRSEHREVGGALVSPSLAIPIMVLLLHDKSTVWISCVYTYVFWQVLEHFTFVFAYVPLYFVYGLTESPRVWSRFCTGVKSMCWMRSPSCNELTKMNMHLCRNTSWLHVCIDYQTTTVADLLWLNHSNSTNYMHHAANKSDHDSTTFYMVLSQPPV
jgi:hypothetical protein